MAMPAIAVKSPGSEQTFPKVGCAGILVADTFCGPVAALPQGGRLITVDAMPVRPGGCAANVAIDLAKQGVQVEVAGCVGQDAAGDMLLSALAGHGIDCRQVARAAGHATSATVILLVKGEDRRYIHAFGANRAFTAEQLQREWLAELKVFYLGGLLALPALQSRELRDLLRFCRGQGVTTVVDVVLPSGAAGMGDLESLLPEVDYFLPNDDEASALTGTDDRGDQLRAFLDAGAAAVVITQGAAGAVAASGESCWHVSACTASAVDPSGAGDAFSAGFITGIARGWDMPRTLCYASALGASATRAVGTTDGVFTAHEAAEFLATNAPSVKVEQLARTTVS